MERIVSRFAADRSGNFVTLGALFAPVALTLMAFAIDEGSLYNERRELQELADLAAITATANIGKAETAAIATLRDNGFEDVRIVAGPVASTKAIGTGTEAIALSITPGRYSANATMPASHRFEAAASKRNAVKITLQKIGRRFFAASLIPPPLISASAIANAPAEAAFSVGSRLLSVDGGLLNAILGGLLGTNLSLSVMDYEGLVKADVEVLKFVDALAIELNLTAATYDEVLEADATIGQIARALASIDGVDSKAKLALQDIARDQPADPLELPLGHLLDLGEAGRVALGNHGAGFGAAASLMEILSASAAIANSGKQLSLDLAGGLPGVLSVTLTIAVGEPPQFKPWFSIGETGDIVRTAQTRLKLIVDLGNPDKNLGVGLKLISVRLPIHLELAYAEAQLTDISCPTGRPDSLKVSIAAQPGVAELSLAETDDAGFADFTKPLSFRKAQLAGVNVDLLFIKLSLLKVNAAANVKLTNMQPTTVTFDNRDIADRAVKTVSTRNLTESLTKSLLDGLKLSIEPLGLPLDLTLIVQLVQPVVTAILTPVTETVDALLYNLLAALGIKVGEADVRIHGASCGRSVLVQ